MTAPRSLSLIVARSLTALALVIALGLTAAPADAEEASWRLEQPSLPPPPPGVAASPTTAPLGKIGDIEFWEPSGAPPQANRGLLITHGNGNAVPAGVWAYDGGAVGWHEIATACGATDGRIAWSGPGDFWTVSDQRPGQASVDGHLPPLADDSLCHFSDGSIVASYAHLAFEADSYEQMYGAACLSPQPPAESSTDCWFGGEALPEPRIGSFHLHWNGSALEEEPYLNQGDPVRDMRQVESAIFESVAYNKANPHNEPPTLARPSVLHLAETGGPLEPVLGELPIYGARDEPTEELEYLRLGSTEGVLWAATGRATGISGLTTEEEGQVVVIRHVGGIWTQVIGPGEEGRGAHPLPHPLPGLSQGEEDELLGGPAGDAQVRAIAPEPGSEDAWLALAPHSQSESQEEKATAVLLHISAQGEVLGVQTLPSAAERLLPSDAAGAAGRLVCPAHEDCWMANVKGWLYHLAREGERTLPYSELPGFPEGKVIGESGRPPDEGIPQEVRDAPPPDTSGLQEEPPASGGASAEQKAAPEIESTELAPLLTHVHSRLIHKTTLELRFHLAVKARIRLIAKRHQKVVASTPMHTFAAGNRKLLLPLDRREWPTKLSLQTHALAPLPSITVTEAVGGPERGAGAHPEIGPNGSVTETVDPAASHMPTFAGLTPPSHMPTFVGLTPPSHMPTFVGLTPPSHMPTFAGLTPPSHMATFAGLTAASHMHTSAVLGTLP